MRAFLSLSFFYDCEEKSVYKGVSCFLHCAGFVLQRRLTDRSRYGVHRQRANKQNNIRQASWHAHHPSSLCQSETTAQRQRHARTHARTHARKQADAERDTERNRNEEKRRKRNRTPKVVLNEANAPLPPSRVCREVADAKLSAADPKLSPTTTNNQVKPRSVHYSTTRF